MNTPEQKDAYKKIEELIKQSERLIDIDATDIADAFGISFNVGDYGSGRTYHPKGASLDSVSCSWLDGIEVDENDNLINGIWISSSEQC